MIHLQKKKRLEKENIIGRFPYRFRERCLSYCCWAVVRGAVVIWGVIVLTCRGFCWCCHAVADVVLIVPGFYRASEVSAFSVVSTLISSKPLNTLPEEDGVSWKHTCIVNFWNIIISTWLDEVDIESIIFLITNFILRTKYQ